MPARPAATLIATTEKHLLAANVLCRLIFPGLYFAALLSSSITRLKQFKAKR
jgi:hypothetical protein